MGPVSLHAATELLNAKAGSSAGAARTCNTRECVGKLWLAVKQSSRPVVPWESGRSGVRPLQVTC